MNQYTEEEKILLLKEYVESGKSANDLAKKRGIPLSTLLSWIKAYGFPTIQDIKDMMKKKNIPDDIQSLQKELVRLRKEKDKEIKRLQNELNEEKLKNLANTAIINLAEKKFHIQIKKKPGAK